MSIDINWETLTQGSDGEALAESIRLFIDDKFQKVPLPRMIRSVKVHSFDFGSVPPQIELKDVCDPLPDFYEGEEDEDDHDENPETGGGVDNNSHTHNHREGHMNTHRDANSHTHGRDVVTPAVPHSYVDSNLLSRRAQLGNSLLSRAATPGILGGTSNLGYFHLPLSAGLSGTTTPLAAVAGAQFQNSRQEPPPARETGDSFDHSAHHRSTSFGSPTSSSATTHSSRPTSRHQHNWPEEALGDSEADPGSPTRGSHTSRQERSVEDAQIVFHVSYSGDVKLSLTAEILLDYPMPSFVGIPLQLNITGLTFDGVGILAYINRKAHFCFLCPEDAEALTGASVSSETDVDTDERKQRAGALLEEIKVESEIGQRENGKQVLKNVGKVEKFVLEQVRRIFDEEFVYPSFWTFLV